MQVGWAAIIQVFEGSPAHSQSPDVESLGGKLHIWAKGFSMSKSHHYIPQHYLRGFSTPEDSSKVWVFERDTKRAFCTNTSNIAHENYFYTFIDAGGVTDRDSIEQFLANEVEDIANRAIDNLKMLHPITANEKLQLARYITYMFSRVPRYRKRVSERLLVLKTQIELAKRQQAVSDTFTDDVLQRIERVFKYAPDRLEQLLQLPHFFDVIFKALIYMNWTFLTRQEPPYFLTSDNPFIFTERRGLGNEKAEIIFPVSRNVMLWATWKVRDYQFLPIEEDAIQKVNEFIADDATRFVFYYEDAAWVYELL